MTLDKKALLLSYITLIYNIGEAVVSIFAGISAGSMALLGFGLDAVIESLSGGIMVWRFSHNDNCCDEEIERKEHLAIQLVALTFFVFGTYVLYASVRSLIAGDVPEHSPLGIIIALVSITLMPALYFVKKRTGEKDGSRSLVADSKQTLACSLMSVALLIGLGANSLFGFWQADPLAGILISFYLFKEGYTTWREKEVCSC